MSAWGLQFLRGLTNSTQRSVNNVKCDTLTSITSELPTAASDWLNAEPRTRDLVSVLTLVGCSLSSSSLHTVFYQNCPSCLSLPAQLFFVRSVSRLCQSTAVFSSSSQQGFVAMDEMNNTCQMIPLGYSATPCKVSWLCSEDAVIRQRQVSTAS